MILKTAKHDSLFWLVVLVIVLLICGVDPSMPSW